MQLVLLLLGCLSLFLSRCLVCLYKKPLKSLAYFQRHCLATSPLALIWSYCLSNHTVGNYIKYVPGTSTHLTFLIILEGSQGKDKSLFERWGNKDLKSPMVAEVVKGRLVLEPGSSDFKPHEYFNTPIAGLHDHRYNDCMILYATKPSPTWSLWLSDEKAAWSRNENFTFTAWLLFVR